MNIQAIMVSNGFGSALLLVLLFSRYRTRRQRRLDDQLFSAMIVLGILGGIVETRSFMIDGRPGGLNRIGNILENSYLYASTLAIATLWVLYVDVRLYRSRERILKKYKFLIATSLLMTALLIVNIFAGFFFTVDENNIYHRMPISYVFYLYLFAAMCISVRTLYVYCTEYGGVSFFPIWMFLVPVISCCILQVIFYGIALAWAGIAMGITAIYINIQSQQAFVDTLTGLYNRQFIEHSMIVMKEDRRSSYYGIMLDIDYFKEINDRFGHSVGDEALCQAANIFRRAAMLDAMVYRFAGDEFIIIMKTNDESSAMHMMDRIRGEMHRFNESGEHPYTLSFSMGCAKLDVSGDTIDTFMHEIDASMYEDKKRNHERIDRERAKAAAKQA
ncbi:MAG: GGDEF domain-containing protein [Lachnospiraceae bacterium]|nr:GGDEF domain-containing protein [Lachnospiraceae bacterium]